MPDTNNYIENLLLGLGTLKTELNDTEPTMGTLSDAQRGALSSLLSSLEYSLTSYNNSDYGCCQDICEAEICFDAPSGYNTPELLEKVSFLINMSNLGVANIPSNAKFKEWYGSVDNNMSRALIGEHVVPVVDWVFENVLRLDKPTNDNTQVLSYSLVTSLLYIVFGDPVLMLKASEGFLAEDSVDDLLNSLVKDVFALEQDDWRGFLASVNETLTKELTEGQTANISITEENVYELVSWGLTNLQSCLNQSEEKDDCSTEYGVKFPSYPGVLWVIVNTVLAVVGSFLISGARGKFGKKTDGSVKWVPSFGLKDTDSSDFSHLFLDTRSPFSGFSVKNVYVENDGYGPVIVQFNEEVTNAEFDFNHASLSDQAAYDVSLKRIDPESTTVCNISVSAHPSEHDKVQLILDVPDTALLDGDYGTDYILKIRIGADAQPDIYNDTGDVDKSPAWTQNWAPDGARRVVAKEGASSGPTFSDFMRWAMDTGDDTFTDCVNYLIDWHSRNLQPDFNDAYVALQSIGWMNRKGSDFAGFLHPESMCGPYIEQLFADYFNTVEEDCVKIKIESSCGTFDCSSMKWSAKCPDGIESIVTMLSQSTIGTNAAEEAGILFAKTEEVVSHSSEAGISLCVVDCAECGNQGCTPDMIDDINQLIAQVDDAISDLADQITIQTEFIATKVQVKGALEQDLAVLIEQHAADEAQYQTDRAQLLQDYDDNFCGTQDATDDCPIIEADIAQIESDWAANVSQFYQEKTTLEADIAGIVTQIIDAGAFLEQYEEEKAAAVLEKSVLLAQLEDCECEDCTNGPWKIIRQGTDASEYTAECLIGWDYSNEGDIIIDETKPAYGAGTISLSSKPNNLLIDKSGDIYADGVKVARVALCGLANTSFVSLFDPNLSPLLIHPKYVGNKRIFHVMQEGYSILEGDPNNLRNELKRHEVLPYPIGRFFQGDPCDDSEPEECIEDACCRNPDLPDCLDIGECGGVTIPQWFRDWYEEHRDYLILKLPYDKRYIGDPMRYTMDEQILVAKAIIDLIVRYFNSTPMVVSNGFSAWSDMTRQLNVLPLLLKESPSRTKFNFGNWMVGKNSNSPEISYPATDENCVECCDDVLNSDCDILDTFEDCCESSCGRWNRDCSYLTGDIVTGLSGEHCYEALKDICAGDCNPIPGSEGSSEIWFRCTPDCENEVPPCDFSVSNNYNCSPDGCDAAVSVALQYDDQPTPNLCDYRWIFTATNVNIPELATVSVESFGKTPTTPWSEITLPLLPVQCDEDTPNPNVWSFTLEARSSISDDVLSQCVSDSIEFNTGCEFQIVLWDDLDAAKAEAYGWCDEIGGENPEGQRQGAPDSALGDAIENVNQKLENLLAWVDTNDIYDLTPTQSSVLVTAYTAMVDALAVVNGLPNDYDIGGLYSGISDAETRFSEDDSKGGIEVLMVIRSTVVSDVIQYGIYAGTSECCCVVLQPTSEENVCDMSWVWTVDTGIGAPIPYYGGVGKLPDETVACAIRNPNEFGETPVSVLLYSYPATCDDYVQSAVNDWNGQFWIEHFTPESICVCERAIFINCPCSPRGGIVNLEPYGCDPQNDTISIVDLSHTNELNECEVQWRWELQELGGNGNTQSISAGIGTEALSQIGIPLNAGMGYQIVLLWTSIVDPTVSGGVFSQTFTTPSCPRLDLTHDFSDNRFSSTTYGAVVANDYSHAGVVGENNGDNTQTPFSLGITTDNNGGTYSIYSSHTPDETDEKWLAVEDDKYTFRWTVMSSQGEQITVDEPALVTTSTYNVKGRVPSLSLELPPSMIGDGFTYSVSLEAIPNLDETVSSGINTIGPFQNSKHHGTRSLQFETVLPLEVGVNSISTLPSGNGEFIPSQNFHGSITQPVNVKSVAQDGTLLETNPVNVSFDVANDPCDLISLTVAADSWVIINAPVANDDSPDRVPVTMRFDASWLLHEECGFSDNPTNPPFVDFRYRGYEPDGSQSPAWDAATVVGNYAWDDSTRTISATFEQTFNYPVQSGGNPSPQIGLIGLWLTATDNELSYDASLPYDSKIGWISLNSPDYRECHDGQWVLSEGQEGDGQPTGCPCVIPELNSSLTWSGTNSDEITHTPQAVASDILDVELHQFLELEFDEESTRDYEYTLISSNGDVSDFEVNVLNDESPLPGEGTLRISSSASIAKGFTKTVVATVGAWNKERFLTYADAVTEGCNVEFTVSVPLIAGCVTPDTVDYFAGANIQPANLDCQPVVLGCTDNAAFNYNAQANVDDGTCYPVIEGCMDPTAFNYINPINDVNVDVNTDDESCIPVITGCNDPAASNYDASVNTPTNDDCCYEPELVSVSNALSELQGNIDDVQYSIYNNVVNGGISVTDSAGDFLITIPAGSLTFPRANNSNGAVANQNSGGIIRVNLDAIIDSKGQSYTITCDIGSNSRVAEGEQDISLPDGYLNIRFGKYSDSRQKLESTPDDTYQYLGDTYTNHIAEFEEVRYDITVDIDGCDDQLQFGIISRLETHNYLVGCMNQEAINYDENAEYQIDDDSCVLPAYCWSYTKFTEKAGQLIKEDAVSGGSNWNGNNFSGNWFDLLLSNESARKSDGSFSEYVTSHYTLKGALDGLFSDWCADPTLESYSQKMADFESDITDLAGKMVELMPKAVYRNPVTDSDGNGIINDEDISCWHVPEIYVVQDVVQENGETIAETVAVDNTTDAQWAALKCNSGDPNAVSNPPKQRYTFDVTVFNAWVEGTEGAPTAPYIKTLLELGKIRIDDCGNANSLDDEGYVCGGNNHDDTDMPVHNLDLGGGSFALTDSSGGNGSSGSGSGYSFEQNPNGNNGYSNDGD